MAWRGARALAWVGLAGALGVALACGGGADVLRALTRTPGDGFTGHTLHHSNLVLNNVLRSRAEGLPGLEHRDCEQMDVEELEALHARLAEHHSPKLQQIYQTNPFPDPRVAVHTPHTLRVANHTLREIARDALCHSVAMAWVHHLTEAGRDAVVAQGVVLPLLPVVDRGAGLHTLCGGDGACKDVVEFYQHKVSCSDCHVIPPNNTSTPTSPSNSTWPVWPADVRIEGLHYGPFPWWCLHDGQGPMNWTCNDRNISKANAHARVSYFHASTHTEVIKHADCVLERWGGPDHAPCTHYFTQENGSFIHAWADQATEFCCVATSLTLPRPDFVNTFTTLGNTTTVPHFESAFYAGPITNHTISFTSQGPIGKNGNNFWYFTTPGGLPVEFGEGCRVSHQGPDCQGDNVHPITLWQFNASSVTPLANRDAVWHLPDACRGDAVVDCDLQNRK